MPTKLQQELAKPEYDGLSRSEIIAAMKAKTRTEQKPVNIRHMLRWAVNTDGLFALNEAVSSGNKDKRRIAAGALALLNSPHIAELDVADPEIGGLLAALVSLGIFTQQQVDQLKARGQEAVNVWQDVGEPTEDDLLWEERRAN